MDVSNRAAKLVDGRCKSLLKKSRIPLPVSNSYPTWTRYVMILNYTSQSAYLIEIGPVKEFNSNEKAMPRSIFYMLNKTILIKLVLN